MKPTENYQSVVFTVLEKSEVSYVGNDSVTEEREASVSKQNSKRCYTAFKIKTTQKEKINFGMFLQSRLQFLTQSMKQS